MSTFKCLVIEKRVGGGGGIKQEGANEFTEIETTFDNN